MKLRDIADMSYTEQYARIRQTIEYRRLLMDLAKFAPGKFHVNPGGYHVAQWDKDKRVYLEVGDAFLNVAWKPMVEIKAQGQVRQEVPRSLLNGVMEFAERHKLTLHQQEHTARDAKPSSGFTADVLPWWVLTLKLPLELYSEA